jgi:hypothetical protein
MLILFVKICPHLAGGDQVTIRERRMPLHDSFKAADPP